MVLLRLLGSQNGYDRSAWDVTVRFALHRLGVTTSSEGVNTGHTHKNAEGVERARGEAVLTLGRSGGDPAAV